MKSKEIILILENKNGITIINFYMDDFIKVIKKDPQVRNKIKDSLDKYIKLSYNYHSKIGFDSLIQNVMLT